MEKKEKVQKLLRILGIVALIAILFVTVLCSRVFAQGVGISDTGKIDPHKAAILELRSQTKGLLIPRMTSQQRLYIPVNATAAGVMVYQTDGEAGFYFYTGTTWQRLIVSTEIGGETGIPNLLAKVATTGDFNDIVDKPFIPARLSELVQDTLYYTTITEQERQRWNTAALSSNTFSGDYEDVYNKPYIPRHLKELEQDSAHLLVTAQERERWNNKADKADIPTDLSQLEQDANYYTTISKEEYDRWNAAVSNTSFSGKYDDLVNKPALARVALSGNYEDVLNRPSYNLNIDLTEEELLNLALVATTGSYNHLINVPLASTDSTGKQLTVAAVALSGDYNDVKDKPNIPTKIQQLAQDSAHLLVSAEERETWNNKAEKADIPTHLKDLIADQLYYFTVTEEDKANWNAIDTSKFFSGEWDDLSAVPDFSRVATTGEYAHLSKRMDRTYLQNLLELHNVAFTGQYSHLNNKPDIYTTLEQFSGTDDASNKFISEDERTDWNAAVIGFNNHKNHAVFDGNYSSMYNTPKYKKVAFTGEYKDLEQKPRVEDYQAALGFKTVAYTGDYNDLEQKPTVDDIIYALDLPDYAYSGYYFRQGSGTEHIPNFSVTKNPQAPHPSTTIPTKIELENPETARIDNTYFIGNNNVQYALADHKHPMINTSPKIIYRNDVYFARTGDQPSTGLQKAVNADFIYNIFKTDGLLGAMNSNYAVNGYGDIIGTGLSADDHFQLKIRDENVTLQQPKAASSPNLNTAADLTGEKEDLRLATNQNLADYATLMKNAIKDTIKKYTSTSVTKDELNRNVPADMVIMYSGTYGSWGKCWTPIQYDGSTGRFPVGVPASGGVTFDVVNDGTVAFTTEIVYMGSEGGHKEITLKTMPEHAHRLWYATGDATALAGGPRRSLPQSGNNHTLSHAKYDNDDNTANYNEYKTASPFDNRPPYRNVYFLQRVSDNQCFEK
jgi:hypothetical protein